ncbi:hypothetical protein K443DRAFT_677386 [Laccaria amethystina LaAM-08-1]|uniref:Uncharacterized protein n=1 Tax=Laccaria amethystina LaAM-08-1 TaxID=1095629 RepID=A0A0C9XY85_9AGAR|nr:hypothetical protein K443DRAFT_684561 [Laccaria amethystina LaAM-08-1]KIK02657.1 hypothetical protein K443DRAFT_677386 [Laccaria amethystina LaAM-08-1]
MQVDRTITPLWFMRDSRPQGLKTLQVLPLSIQSDTLLVPGLGQVGRLTLLSHNSILPSH